MMGSEGLTKGQYFEKHVGVDKYYNGGPIPDRHGGGSWSADDMGWPKYGPMKKIWVGTPRTTKDILWVGATTPIWAAHQLDDDEDIAPPAKRRP